MIDLENLLAALTCVLNRARSLMVIAHPLGALPPVNEADEPMLKHGLRKNDLEVLGKFPVSIINFAREKPGLHKRTQSRLPAPPTILEFPGNAGKLLEEEGSSCPIEENLTELEQETTLLPPDGGEGKNRTTPKLRPADPLWSALVSVMGAGPATASERGSWNLATKQLREAGATSEQIHQRAQNYRERSRDAALTPTALAKHWGSLSIRAPAITSTAQSREQRLAELAVVEERVRREEQQRKSHAAT